MIWKQEKVQFFTVFPRSQTPFGNAFLDAPRRTFSKHKKLFILLQNYRKKLILLFFYIIYTL